MHSYGWVDQQAGVVRIPIDRAMELLAQRGLPTRPQAGAVPPSDVNMAKEAARRSDTSASPRRRSRIGRSSDSREHVHGKGTTLVAADTGSTLERL